MHIKKIQIKNFRSIKNQTIHLDNINIFYGLNDVGKSNVLKALNLFFNNRISHLEKFDFKKDFCNFATTPNRKAEEIVIRITLSPPQSYKDNKDFIWEKVWRRDGLHKDVFIPDPEESKDRKIQIKCAWARKLKYRYVPAMKDELYFSNLLKELYEILSESISENLSKASNEFLGVIKKSTEDMSDDLYHKLGFKSEISFPDNLASLFSTLDFETERNNNLISLRNRGDGIKIRHIPSILRFFHNENNRLNSNGSIRTDTIWGYEEPENNLEGLATFDKANQFIEISDEIQILLTTHSPAFYLIKDKCESCNLYQTEQKVLGEGTVYNKKENISDNSIYRDDLEFLALISPFIEKEINKRDAINKELEELKNKVASSNKVVVFVEGQYDIDYINKAAEKLGKNELLNKVELLDGDGFGNLDKIWRNENKAYNIIKNKMILLYDCDTNKEECGKGRMIKRVIPTLEDNYIKSGIENLIPNETILKIESEKPCFIDVQQESKRIVRGKSEISPEVKSVNKDEKRNLCNWMCEYGTESDFRHFSIIFDIIESELLK